MLDVHSDAHEAAEDGAAADDGEPAGAELVAALARVGGPVRVRVRVRVRAWVYPNPTITLILTLTLTLTLTLALTR